AGASKFTDVAGWDALARAVRRRMLAPKAIAPTNTSRRVSMGLLPWCDPHSSAYWLFAEPSGQRRGHRPETSHVLTKPQRWPRHLHRGVRQALWSLSTKRGCFLYRLAALLKPYADSKGTGER